MNYKYSTPYNIYFGTIGKTLGVKYRYTKNFKNEEQALNHAKNAVKSFYYKNEGKFGLPSYIQILKESEITEVPIERLYEEHIEDMTRYWVIPSEWDSIPNRKLKWQ